MFYLYAFPSKIWEREKIERGEPGSLSVKTLDIILSSLGYEIYINLSSGYGIPTLS